MTDKEKLTMGWDELNSAFNRIIEAMTDDDPAPKPHCPTEEHLGWGINDLGDICKFYNLEIARCAHANGVWCATQELAEIRLRMMRVVNRKMPVLKAGDRCWLACGDGTVEPSTWYGSRIDWDFIFTGQLFADTPDERALAQQVAKDLKRLRELGAGRGE